MNEARSYQTPVLSVVMPVFNEEEALPGVLAEAWQTLTASGVSFEYLLVDDASHDRSPEILEAFQAEHPEQVRVLRNETNRGIMGSFTRLYAEARGDFIFINGSDGQVRTAEVLRMLPLRQEYDIIVGRRRNKQYTPWRKVISWSFNQMPRVLFGVATHDAGCVKLMRREVAGIPLSSTSPFREAERLIRARRLGYRIGCVDIEHLPRRGGLATGSRWSLLRHSLADVARCWWDLQVGHRAPVKDWASGHA